jgi:hypothetical protein
LLKVALNTNAARVIRPPGIGLMMFNAALVIRPSGLWCLMQHGSSVHQGLGLWYLMQHGSSVRQAYGVITPPMWFSKIENKLRLHLLHDLL